jgi:hypothetical protein
MYKTKEPILSCNGSLFGYGFPYGNWTARLGDLLISAGTFDRVIICNVAAGGTTSLQWAKGGDCNNRLVVAAKRLLAAGLQPTRVLRHQGETDASSGAFTAAEVTANIWSEVDTLRDNGITARVMVSHVAYYRASSVGTADYLAVRQGQSDAVDATRDIILGPDTDTLGSAFRQSDDLHWSASGAAAVADLFKDAIIADLD